MRIAIVDDLPSDVGILKDNIAAYCQEYSLSTEIDSFYSAKEFLEKFTPSRYSLIFLDIYIDEMDGMELAHHIRAWDNEVLLLFITTTSEYAIQGYAVSAAGYLLKPYTYSQFKNSMDICLPRLQKSKRYIQVKENRCYVKILLNDILYTDYNNHYIQIHTPNRMIRSYMPFRTFAPMLLQFDQFLCCYRNIIINMDHVLGLENTDFLMDNEERIPLRRPDKSILHQKYADYIFQKMNGGMDL